MKIIITSLIIAVLLGSSEAGQSKVKSSPSKLEIKITHSKDNGFNLACKATGEELSYRWYSQKGHLLDNEVAKENVLSITGATSKNYRNFCCRASNTAGSQAKCATLPVTYSYSVLRPFPIGSSVHLKCVVDPIDPRRYVIKWKREDGLPIPKKAIVDGGHLKIGKLIEADAGIYICIGSRNGVYEVFRHRAILEVVSPRKNVNQKFDSSSILNVTAPPGPIKITMEETEEEKLRMTCEATGDQLSYNWTAEGGLRSNEEQGLQDLMIDEFEKANDRTFCCIASNTAGQVEKCTRVSRFVQISASYGSIRLGNPFEMNCQVFGSDASKIHLQWQRPTDQELSKNATIKDGLLKIHNVTVADGGFYNCIGLDDDGNELVRRDFLLVLPDSPIITVPTVTQ